MNPFFQSVADANRAYCAALGLSAAELYGTAPNAEEFEVHRQIKSGVRAEDAQPVFRARKAKHLKYWPRTGIQQLGFIEEQMRQRCYTFPDTFTDRDGNRYQPHTRQMAMDIVGDSQVAT